MKFTKYFGALIAIFALAFLSTLESCSSTSSASAALQKSENYTMLSQGGWVMNSATREMDDSEEQLDMFFFMNESEKSDVLYFYPNNKAVKTTKVFKSGKVVTQPNLQGDWTLVDNGTKLIITAGDQVTELMIESLNDSQLVVSVVEFDEILGKEIKSTFGYKS